MTYYVNLFSPETYCAFSRSDRNISGFRESQARNAEAIHPGDRLLCYMTKTKRWIGILEVVSEHFHDETPIFLSQDDPFTRRFRVRPLVWLAPEQTIPITEDICWNALSFTAGKDKNGSAWTGMIRGSLRKFSEADGRFLEALLLRQVQEGRAYPLTEAEKRLFPDELTPPQPLREEPTPPAPAVCDEFSSEHTQMQAKLARIGECMQMQIWLPRADRARVLREWHPQSEDALLADLPFRYDERTMRIIENIDVLWVDRHAIVRAFEIEHTTSIYSGLLRMSDLIALQPNLSIRAHIVAPPERRERVLREMVRPTFTLMGNRRPLPDFCSYLSYDSVEGLSRERNLRYLNPNVLDEYAEQVPADSCR